jgi:transposase
MDAPTLNGIECQSGGAEQPLKRMGASTMKITTVGIDLAKNVFQVHGVDEGVGFISLPRVPVET